MCGIGGIIRLEDSKGNLAPEIYPTQIDMLLNSLEYRGNDAAGVALISRSGEIFVHKDHEPAWDVTSSPAYKTFLKDKLSSEIISVLVHTRKATKGSPYTNDNNHPLIKQAGVCVHNGMLSNDDFLFKDMKLDRGAETDSDILRAILDANNGVSEKTIREMCKVSGSVASALVHPSDPTKVLLLRSGNPLVVGDDGERMYFASDKRAIYRAARPWIKRHGMWMQLQAPRLAFVTMPNDTGWIVGAKGVEFHDKFTASATRYRFQNYSDVYAPTRRARQLAAKPTETKPPALPAAQPVQQTQQRQVPQQLQQVDYVKCPNGVCGYTCSLSEEQKTKPLNRMMCPKCSTNLGMAQKSTRDILVN